MWQGVNTPQARRKVLFLVTIFLDVTLKHNMAYARRAHITSGPSNGETAGLNTF